MNKSDLAYHYGIFLGDGFVENYCGGKNCNYKSSTQYIGLKSVDRELVEHWRDVLYRLTGTYYKIRQESKRQGNQNARWRCRAGKREFVQATLEATAHKKKIPGFILHGSDEIKKSIIQGLMDAEAWISFSLRSIGSISLQLAFANTDTWIFEFHRLFSDLGIETSKVHKRHGREGRKDVFYFYIDIMDYVNAGLGFNIRRKQERLDYCTRILTDYMQNYPRYKDYFDGLEDIVGPVVKATG